MESTAEMAESDPIRAGSTRELLGVAIPLMLSFGSQSLMQFVDRIFLTWYSQESLAATMPAGLLCWTLLSLAFGVAYMTATFIAQYEGAGQKTRVASVIWQSTWLAWILGGLLSLTILIAPAVFHSLGHAAAVAEAEVIYFSVLMGGAPVTLWLTSLSGFFSGRNQTTIVLWVNLLAVVVNLVCDYFLIFGHGPFPEMGIRGAGLATVAGNLTGCLLFCLLIGLTCRWQHYPLCQQCGFDYSLCKRMLRHGLPLGTQSFVDVAGFTVFSFVVGNAGTVELAATNIAFNLNTLAFVPMIGLGVGVMTLVGRRVGEGRIELAEKSVQRALVVGFIYMGLWSLAYLFFPRWLLHPFALFAVEAEFDQVQELVIVLLRFIAVYSLFDAMALVYGYAIRGAGDTLYPLLIFLYSSLTCLVIPALYILWYWQANLYACWAAATVYIAVIGICMRWRYRGGKWKTMRVIEAAEEL